MGKRAKQSFQLKAGLAVLLGFHLWCAWYAFDLEQANPETIFLTKDGQASYAAFKDKTQEKQSLLVSFRPKQGVDDAVSKAFAQELSALRKTFPEPHYYWISWFDVYGNAVEKQDVSAAFAFLQNLTRPLLFPLMGKNHLATLLLFDKSDQEFARLLAALQNMQKNLSPGVEMDLGGLPFINFALNEAARPVKETLMPLVFLLGFLLSWYLTKSLRLGVLLIVPCLCATFLSLATIKYFLGTLNMITAALPLMMLVINLTLCFHVTLTTLEERSFYQAMRIKWRPLFLSVLTMAIGFGSCAFTPIKAIEQFAWAALFLIIFTAMVSVLYLYMVRDFLLSAPERRTPLEAMLPTSTFARVLNFKQIAVLCVLIAAALFWCLPRTKTLTDATQYFPPGSPVRQQLQRLETDIVGTPIFEILVQKKDASDFSHDDFMQMKEVEGAIAKNLPGAYKILSLNRAVQEANFIYSGVDDTPSYPVAYLALTTGLHPTMKNSYGQRSFYRLTLLGKNLNAQEFKAHLSTLQQTFETWSTNYAFEFNGLNMQLMLAQDSLLQVLGESLFVSLGIIMVLFGVFYRSLRHNIAFLITSLIPVGACLIYIYVLGFSLNIATVLTFSIALGMVVDNTFHVTGDKTLRDNIVLYAAETGRPIMASAIILFLGFGIFGLVDFVPVRQLGILLSLTLVTGVYASLWIHPTLIGKGRRSNLT